MKYKLYIKRFFASLLLMAVSALSWAYDFEVDGIYYNISWDRMSVSVTFGASPYSYSGSVTIPSSVTYSGKSYNVTSIGGVAFEGCSGLTSITIPESVTKVYMGAFSGCSGLAKAEFASIESLCNISFESNTDNPLYPSSLC